MTNPDPHSSPETAVPKLALVTKPGQVTHGHPSEAPADVPAVDAPVDNQPVADPLTVAMDRLSLTQALLDVEVANARVLDLTARLVEANQRADAVRADLEAARSDAARIRAQADADITQMRNEMAAHQAYLDEQRSSTAFRWAAKVWNLRNALRS